MNIVLAYYDLIDDWHDDKNVVALTCAKTIEREFKKVHEKYKTKCTVIENYLLKLTEMEKQNLLNPDITADCFGELMGEVFVPYQDKYSEKLRAFGKAIGKFIYILDACVDRDKDIKHQKYNPLVTYSKDSFDDILNILMAECINTYKELNLSKNQTLIENILYSGVWIKYNLSKAKNNKHKEVKVDDTRSV